ncbi:MAG: bifunctional metallophosphatase/5'-nucleotidase [Acidimicrobiales bacterium]
MPRSTALRRRSFTASLFAILALFVSMASAGASATPPGQDSPPAGGPPARLFELTILHINDGESALLPTAELPGAARFVGELAVLQKQASSPSLPPRASARARRAVPQRAVVTISSGDNFLAGPRLSASLDDPEAFYDAFVYTRARFDAMTVGNHELDFGPDVLADFIEATGDIPFLSANLDVSGEKRLADLEDDGRIAASTVVERLGRRIGIVGATTPQLPIISSPRGVVVTDVLPAVQAEVDALRADGVNIIVLSSHLQDLDQELDLVTRLRGVDAVIGGGGGEDIGASYPLLATDADGRTVPVVTTPGDYADIGRLVLRFDAAGDLVDVAPSSALLPVPLSGPIDTATKAMVEDPVAAYVANLAGNEIARTAVPLDGRRQGPGVRDRETNLGNLFADALVATARARADDFGVPLADIGLQNGGGMRQEKIIPTGPVTELDTYDIAPFANFVSVADITGAQLKSALERSVAALPGAGGFHGQWSGISFTYDPSRQAQVIDIPNRTITTGGQRIVDAVVTRSDGTTVTLVQDGTLVAPGEVFTIVAADFLLNGGDGYFSLDDSPFTALGVTYQQALASQLMALGTVTAAQYPDISVNEDDFTRFGPVDRFSIG